MKSVLILCLVITCISAASILEVDEHITNEVNLEEGNHFQGDVLMTDQQLEYMRGSIKLARTGLTNSRYRWLKIASGQVNIPYYLEPSSPYSEH